MSAATWATIIAAAVEAAIETAKRLGLPDLGQDDIDDVMRHANEAAAKLLPAEAAAIAMIVNAVSANIIAKIQLLPRDPKCPKCGGVLRVRAQVSPHDPKNTSQVFSCDNCDGVK